MTTWIFFAKLTLKILKKSLLSDFMTFCLKLYWANFEKIIFLLNNTNSAGLRSPWATTQPLSYANKQTLAVAILAVCLSFYSVFFITSTCARPISHCDFRINHCSQSYNNMQYIPVIYVHIIYILYTTEENQFTNAWNINALYKIKYHLTRCGGIYYLNNLNTVGLDSLIKILWISLHKYVKRESWSL